MESSLRQLIQKHASKLNLQNSNVDPAVLLAALAFCESSFGKNTTPRVEPAYLPGGRYFQAKHVQQAYKKYGQAAAASYGPWQVLYITALELGFTGSPQELAEPETNLEYAIKYINQRILRRGAKTVAQIADGYNSGNFNDSNVPHSYIRKLVRAYNGIARDWLKGI